MLEWIEDEGAQALVLETPALQALGRVTAYETSACGQHCLALIRLPLKLGVRNESRTFFVQFRQALSKDAIHGPIAGCTLRNRQAQPVRGLLGLTPRGAMDNSPSYWVLKSSRDFAGQGHPYAVPSAKGGPKSQAAATAAAARDGAAHVAGAEAYQAERLTHPECSPDEAREASGASEAQSRTGANGLGFSRAHASRAAAAATGGAAYQDGAAHIVSIGYLRTCLASRHSPTSNVLTYSCLLTRLVYPAHLLPATN